jgi:hypothetical protein
MYFGIVRHFVHSDVYIFCDVRHFAMYFDVRHSADRFEVNSNTLPHFII